MGRQNGHGIQTHHHGITILLGYASIVVLSSNITTNPWPLIVFNIGQTRPIFVYFYSSRNVITNIKRRCFAWVSKPGPQDSRTNKSTELSRFPVTVVAAIEELIIFFYGDYSVRRCWVANSTDFILKNNA